MEILEMIGFFEVTVFESITSKIFEISFLGRLTTAEVA
jgi:hypothetical protein